MVTNTTVTTEVVETGEKRDRLGRKLTSAARRASLVATWRQSGLTQAAFARREGVRYPTFASWVQQARQSQTCRHPRAPERIAFAEVAAPAPAPTVRLEVRLADGTTVRGERPESLAQLVRALRA
jgi:transposase-like protein